MGREEAKADQVGVSASVDAPTSRPGAYDHASDRQERFGDVREWAESTDPPEKEHECPRCGDAFQTERQLRGHRAHCDE